MATTPPAPSGATIPVSPPPGQLPHRYLEQLVDQAAHFHLWTGPSGSASGALPDGFRGSQTIHTLDVDLSVTASSVRAANRRGPVAGRIDCHWLTVPRNTTVLPGVTPGSEPFDSSRSQRVAIVETRFTFATGESITVFGSGRTFPGAGAGSVLTCLIGEISSGTGRFEGHQGNLTFCGVFSPQAGFEGHVMVRILDYQGTLVVPSTQPSPDYEDLAGTATFLTFVGRKPEDATDVENRPSFAADGSMRGLNIPAQIHRATALFDARSMHVAPFRAGEIVAREIGFGKGSVPGASPIGTALDPFLFEGVSRYTFRDASGADAGWITTNVLEGRRIDVKLPGAPDAPALRFGFFGPIVQGSGCFEGATGFLYGASGSVLYPPPGDHVISNWYAVRLDDPDGRFRNRDLR